jgi:GGDEF domain-containing protein
MSLSARHSSEEHRPTVHADMEQSYQHGNRELSRLSIEADEALYRAKAAGRNGFALYGDR